MKPVVEIKGVTKKIKNKKIIDSLSLDIFPGEVFGFLGPNGAGKTLLDNAVRYGGDVIHISFWEDRQGGKLFISIKDNGMGIEEKDLPLLFNRFYRGEKSRSRELGGTGLGLSISQSIIQAHDGEITLKSKLGEGSEFVIALPLYKA